MLVVSAALAWLSGGFAPLQAALLALKTACGARVACAAYAHIAAPAWRRAFGLPAAGVGCPRPKAPPVWARSPQPWANAIGGHAGSELGKPHAGAWERRPWQSPDARVDHRDGRPAKMMFASFVACLENTYGVAQRGAGSGMTPAQHVVVCLANLAHVVCFRRYAASKCGAGETESAAAACAAGDSGIERRARELKQMHEESDYDDHEEGSPSPPRATDNGNKDDAARH